MWNLSAAGRGVRLGAVLVSLGLVLAWSGGARAQCAIDGPSRVSVNTSFTLCAPGGDAYDYEWHGPGVEGRTSRCVTIPGRATGDYEFELTVWTNGRNPQRCRHVVRVGAGAGGNLECAIEGPARIATGATAELCAPRSSMHTYRWTGPGGFQATTRCVQVSRAGVYDVTVRNVVTGFVRQCSHRLEVAGQGDDDWNGCSVTGPRSLPQTGPARLCAELASGATYRWTGPAGFAGNGRCISVNRAGTYTVTLRNANEGWSRSCSFTLGDRGEYDEGGDPDAPFQENCPRGLGFWRQVCNDRGAGSRELTQREMLVLARCIDARSRYFNWGNDISGLCAALSPGRPMTQRKLLARQFAVLLANVCAASEGATMADGSGIGLDEDTRVSAAGGSTVAQVISRVDALLLAPRGDFTRTTQLLTQINSGRGIGRICD